MDEDLLKYELWFSKLDITNTSKNRLSDCMKDSRNIYNASKSQLLETNMIDESIADRIINDREKCDVIDLYNKFKSYEQRLITRIMDNYPEKLKNIQQMAVRLILLPQQPKRMMLRTMTQ